MENPFWKTKSLSAFSDEEWESVCMKCGKCCMQKGEHNGKVLFFNRVCDGLDMKTGLCTRYKSRLCTDCVKVDLHLLQTEPSLLPESCAYRLLLAGKDLPEWHPLISGDPESVRKAGKSVLDVSGVHSEKDFEAEMKLLAERSSAENWSLGRAAEEVCKIGKKYPLRAVESYPTAGSIKLL